MSLSRPESAVSPAAVWKPLAHGSLAAMTTTTRFACAEAFITVTQLSFLLDDHRHVSEQRYVWHLLV